MDAKQMILKDNWRFLLGDCPDAWRKDYDDGNWEEICIPHDWSVTLPFSREYSSGTGYVAGGIGWYRGRFYLPEHFRGKRIFLRFDGVYKNSKVWCNSYYKGFHPYGYTPFSYDITDDVVFGAEPNVITLRADQREISDSRWFTGAGITRKVTLVVTEPVYVEENGMSFTTPQVSDKKASLCFRTEVKNTYAQQMDITVTNELLTQDGERVGVYTSCISVPGGSTVTALNAGTLAAPALWSPGHPSLYQIRTYLSWILDDEKEEITPVLADTSFSGIRSIRFDPQNGFFLNEVPMKIKGVCVHHDAGALGGAVTKEVWLRRLLKLKEMGCNAIRTSHNPHMPELYDLCDRLGFLVMDEAFDEWEGCKNKWSTGHNVYPPKHQGYYEYFPAWHQRDLAAMIRRDRNHPCVILWSIGNEIDYPNDPYCHPLFQTMTGNNDANKPAAEQQYNPGRPNTERLALLAARLSGEVREIDPTRPVTLAAAFPELSAQIGFLDSLDIAGYNYKEHLYEESHKKFPSLPFIGSENSHSLVAWHAVTENDYISGQFLWTGIDYLGEAHGWPVRASGAGLLTLAGFEKPGYYRRMSFWSEKPMAHLVTVRAAVPGDEWKPFLETWNYTPGEPIEVRCYTNLPEAALYLNGKPVGTKQKDFQKDGISWILPFTPGTLEVHAFGSSQSGSMEQVCDRLETVYAPGKLSLSIFEMPKTAHLCEESDLIQAEVTVLDPLDRPVVTDSSMLQVNVEGGTLIGLENGDIADCTEYRSPMRRVYHGKLLIFARRCPNARRTTITVSHETLKEVSVAKHWDNRTE